MLTLLLLACGPCPELRDIEVTDPEGLAPEGMVEQIQAAIGAFEVGSGRTSVCVGEVRLVPDLRSNDIPVGGNYQGRRIEISTSAGAPFGITLHELCHALDDQEGLSQDWGDLPIDPDLNPDLYATRSAQERETFADACGRGPHEVVLQELLQSCGLDLDPLGEVDAYVQETVWTAAQRAQFAPTGLEIQVGESRFLDLVPRGSRVGDAIGVGGDLLLLVESEVAPPRLVLVDPDQGTERARLDLSGDAFDPRLPRRRILISGAEGPWLLEAGQTARLWQIDLEGGTLVDLGFLALEDASWIDEAGISEGILYYSSFDEAWRGHLFAWDIAHAQPLDMEVDPRLFGADLKVFRLTPSPGGVLVQSATEGLNRYEPAEGRWQSMGLQWAGIAPGLERRPDGIWLGSSSAFTEEGDRWLYAYLGWDEQSGQWLLPQEPCESVLWEPQQQRLVVAGERFWAIDGGIYEGTSELRARLTEIGVGP